jgi:hypothetical protein
MEHFKETEWSGFYIGSEGSIQNQTGFEGVKCFQQGVVYVGILAHGRRNLKKLANLVYRYHVRNGREIPNGFIVAFKDKNPKNCKASNLYLVENARKWNMDQPYCKLFQSV